MIRSVILFVALSILVNYTTFSQTDHQDRQLFIYNTVLGGLTSSIGAVINKPKGMNWRKVFVRGLWQGSIGGFVNYTGKKTVLFINKNNEKIWAWPANILHYAGVSIIENSALNEAFLQNWHYEFGPVRFDFSTNGKRPFKARFLPEVIYAVYYTSKAGSFDLGSTLSTGHLIFINHDDIFVIDKGVKLTGFSTGRAIAIGKEHAQTNINIAHEIGHQYQYSEYQVFNSYLKPLEKKVSSKFLNTLFSKYVYFDFPYFYLVYPLGGSYRNDNTHFKNFYEFEAERFATNAYVPR